MELNKKASFCSLLFLLLLLSSQDVMPKAQARLCRLPSRGFKGLCFSDTNCAQVCITEGYKGGTCHGLRRRCMCQKLC